MNGRVRQCFLQGLRAAGHDDFDVVHQNDVRLRVGLHCGAQQIADVGAETFCDPRDHRSVRDPPAGFPTGNGGAVHKQHFGKLLLRYAVLRSQLSEPFGKMIRHILSFPYADSQTISPCQRFYYIFFSSGNQFHREKRCVKATQGLVSFREKTGITPALTTTSWVTSMFWPASLEDYAYSDYVTKFKDEKHWLIVYQSKDNFEGMQGDETDNILTKEVTKKFNYAFHDYLVKDNTLTESLVKAFDDITPKIMDFST